jgi:AbrB family looped-hinge helix DNA binding protein
MPTSTLTSKGQITIPREIREALHLSSGDQVDFILAADGHVEMRPLGRKVRESYGLLYRPGVKPAADPDAELSEELAKDDERIKRGRR